MERRLLTIGERVWNDNGECWAKVLGISDKAPDMVKLLNDINGVECENMEQIDNVYQIAEGVRTIEGCEVCIEHNPTGEGYPYYCPERQENMFACECLIN